jgi:hypothetical protein
MVGWDSAVHVGFIIPLSWRVVGFYLGFGSKTYLNYFFTNFSSFLPGGITLVLWEKHNSIPPLVSFQPLVVTFGSQISLHHCSEVIQNRNYLVLA